MGKGKIILGANQGFGIPALPHGYNTANRFFAGNGR